MHALRRIRSLFAAVCLAAPVLALAAPAGTHLRIDKIYSTLDGGVQAVELRIVRFENQPLALAGKTMVVRDRRGAVRTVPLVANPYAVTTYDGRHRILISTLATDYWGPYSDLVMPIATLPIDGGTITIDGWDEVAYGRLPEDGRHAVTADGQVVVADFGHWGTFDIAGTTAVEFRHAGLDHYFMTNRLDEIVMLTEGVIPGWQPTGKAFHFYTRQLGQGFSSVCRYLLQRPGSASHFFSGFESECAQAAAMEGSVLELATAFVAGMPVSGACPLFNVTYPNGSRGIGITFAPIYRLWNGRPDSNHRYVADQATRDAMIAQGWVPEGDGAHGIGMCALATAWPYP